MPVADQLVLVRDADRTERSLFVRQGASWIVSGRVARCPSTRAAGGRSVATGPGVASAEAPVSGRWAGHAGLWSRFLNCPPGPAIELVQRQRRGADR